MAMTRAIIPDTTPPAMEAVALSESVLLLVVIGGGCGVGVVFGVVGGVVVGGVAVRVVIAVVVVVVELSLVERSISLHSSSLVSLTRTWTRLGEVLTSEPETKTMSAKKSSGICSHNSSSIIWTEWHF